MIKAASEKGEVGWVAIQPGPDVITFPTASGSFFFTESPAINQEPVHAQNKEITDSYAEKQGKFCGYKAGSVKFNMNVKTSGTKGTLSPIHPFILAVYGRHTVTPNTSVTYNHYRRNPEDPFIYLTILLKTQTFTHLLINVRVKKMEIAIKKDDILPVSFDCIFEKVISAGNSTLKTTINGTPQAPVTEIPLNGEEEYQTFQEGCYVYVGSDDNSGAGFLVTAVSKTNNSLTIQDGVTSSQTAGVAIGGFTPVTIESGNNIQAGISWKSVNTGERGTRTIYFTDLKFNVENGVKPLENICSDSNVIGFSEDNRKVNVSVTRYYGTTNENIKYLIEKEVQIPLTIQVGQEEGNIVQVVCPNWRVIKENVSGKEAKTDAIDGQCYVESGDDESTLILR